MLSRVGRGGRVLGVCVLPALFWGAAAGWGQDVSPSFQTSIDQAVAKVKPALIRVHVVFTEYSDGRELKFESMGSGVIITKEGHAVTNHHVAGHATRLFCTLADKEEIEADLVGADPLTDLAVIKLKPEKPREFPVAVFGDSTKIKVGQPVLAMGSPMALSQSVTVGVISNVEMIMPEWLRAWGEMKEEGEDVGALVKWIGHDAKIAGGNSGGALVNIEGEIIGINEISMGLGGAIPANLVKGVAEQLVAKGNVRRAWLGISAQPRLKHAKEHQGVLISGALTDSPAAEAGIKSGDLLVRLNGTAVDVQFAEQMPDFNRLAADLPIGQPVEAVLLRDGKELTVKVTPVEREKAKLKERELKDWGFTASDISLLAAKEMKRKNREGVLVTSVRPGGGAGSAKPAIEPEDVLVEVNGKPVHNVRELVDITGQIREGKTEPVPVSTTFERKTERYLTMVKVGIKELEDPGLEVKKAWLPIETQVLTKDIAESLGRSDLTGFRITQVYAGSTAEKAGLKTGDFIVALDGEKLTASAPENYEELAALIRQYKVGSAAKLSVLRGAEPMTIPVELVLAPKLSREMKQYRDTKFDLTVRDITFFDKAREQWKAEQQGVMVADVKTGGWAALGHLTAGDLILAVDGTPMTDVLGFEAKMKAIAADKPQFVDFEVLRGIYTFYVELEPKWDNNG